MTRVVLASASTGRLRVLRGAGIDPLVVVSGVDEDAVVAALPRGSGPAAVTTALAAAKADAVVAELPDHLRADAVVIGCDSMLERDGRLWGKPGTAEAVREAWRAMAGRAGTLYTGHSVHKLRDGATLARCDEHSATTVRFGEPTEADVAAYAETGEPQGVAGAFTLDGRGGWFVEGIDGDPSAVIGLSLPMLRGMLGRCGLTVADLWRDNPPSTTD